MASYAFTVQPTHVRPPAVPNGGLVSVPGLRREFSFDGYAFSSTSDPVSWAIVSEFLERRPQLHPTHEYYLPFVGTVTVTAAAA